jgi:hypothetical protein
VPFRTLVADPVPTLERVYERAGLELDPATREAFARYLSDHPRGKQGQVRYHLERDFGVSPRALRQRFDFYFQRFPVSAEAA